MTRYKKCPFCGAVRMLCQTLEIDGVKGKYRTCFKCFKVQQLYSVKKDGSVKKVYREIR